MVIEKNIYPYIALRDEPLSSALKRLITINQDLLLLLIEMEPLKEFLQMVILEGGH